MTDIGDLDNDLDLDDNLDLVLPTPEEFSVDGIVKAYRLWLEVKAPNHLKAFNDRLHSAPEGARAEAVTFNLLRMNLMNPKPGEVLGRVVWTSFVSPNVNPHSL
jgi:hypothetical protein